LRELPRDLLPDEDLLPPERRDEDELLFLEEEDLLLPELPPPLLEFPPDFEFDFAIIFNFGEWR
jgi:hypothetical protein